jgi:uncharacterized membrane protein
VSDPIRWTRTALEARLEALEQRHTGDDLINAIVEFAATLTDEDRRLFQDVLLKKRRPTLLRLPRKPPPPDDS